jgi:hypothetical protein
MLCTSYFIRSWSADAKLIRALNVNFSFTRNIEALFSLNANFLYFCDELALLKKTSRIMGHKTVSIATDSPALSIWFWMSVPCAYPSFGVTVNSIHKIWSSVPWSKRRDVDWDRGFTTELTSTSSGSIMVSEAKAILNRVVLNPDKGFALPSSSMVFEMKKVSRTSVWRRWSILESESARNAPSTSRCLTVLFH